MEKEILNNLKKVVANVKGVELSTLDNVDENTKIREDLGLNSIGVLYVVFAIEQEFSIRFNELNFDSFITVGDVLNYIKQNL